MANVKLVIAYDGSNLFGWQKTITGPSVEEELEKALQTILRHPLSLQAASRTDRGVHARGQVVNFFTESPLNLSKLVYSLNCILPNDIRVMSGEIAPDKFHPTLDVVAKEYHYYISRTQVELPFKRLYSWHCPFIKSVEAMREAAPLFVGKKDFSGFSNACKGGDEKDAVKNLMEIRIEESKEEIAIAIRADHFLYKMARNIAGTLAYIGMGKLNASDIEEVFLSKDRTRAGITAPAKGLFLTRVFYEPVLKS
ncbi:tRNA pseudouridine(38-40) synthase TruA [Estrella lausannensis]|uniref:tRNA pseudouridine synthase A n=1 Tax=Estrella lausannensis TaxID=483423 RepID=A0A0H5DRU6_9BACT|nr:tRNA pseudouridine(38-40) synthase TruA [Estrella lausannensis]CRX39441.1 tRNA pseudouridine synthase A 2 [Estrella lausannensis]